MGCLAVVVWMFKGYMRAGVYSGWVMPEFLDLFVSQVVAKRERLASVLSFGRRGVFDEEFRRLLMDSWRPLPEAGAGFSRVAGVDGSRALRFYVVGSVLYVVRAVGVYDKEIIRELEVDAFTSSSSIRDINRFVNRKMEWLEHRVCHPMFYSISCWIGGIRL